jgi:putative DNA primase/helicase
LQVALGLAHKYDLLPFDSEQIGWAISECFHAWLASRGGDGSIGIKQAVKRIERLFVTNEISDRIDDLRDGTDSKVRNLLAHRKCDSDGDTTEFWVPPSVFEKEMCEGVNKTELIAELQVIKRHGDTGDTGDSAWKLLPDSILKINTVSREPFFSGDTGDTGFYFD